MEVSAILDLLPDKLLDDLAVQTNVNYYSKKLQGQIVFKLLLYCILSHKDNSLRTMESAYESIAFNLLNKGSDAKKVRFSSISERLSTIEPSYFEKLYQGCVTTYRHLLSGHQNEVTRFDSTIVALSGKLLKTGYQIKGGGAEHVKQLKFTIGYEHIPVAVHFFNDQQHTSENIALKEAILSWQPDKDNTVRVFDKGITARKTYDELIEKKIPFVSRISDNHRSEQCFPNKLREPIETATLTITSDSWAYLFTSRQRSVHPVRLIQAVSKSTDKQLVFITNITDICAEDITVLYKRRWDIEVFFKFLKQHLNFSHLLNRSDNGIKVVLYATLIAAILVLAYKKVNNFTGFKIVQQRFVQQLEAILVKEIVTMCGGNPAMVDEILRKPPI